MVEKARLQAGVRKHIAQVSKERDELVASARPPQALFDAIQDDVESMALGKELNRRFASGLNSAAKESRFERARFSAENYLALFPPEQQRKILLASLASTYTSQIESTSDTVAWLANNFNSTWFAKTSIARQTIEALKEIEILK